MLRFLLSLFLLSSITAYTQVNTPVGSNRPFPQNVKYSYGIMPANANYMDALNAYNSWRNKFVRACPNGRYRILWDDTTKTVSEGIGYGMLLAAYAADKPLFDGLLLYSKDFNDGRGLMSWQINDCSSDISGVSATDADEDIAMALIVAHYQWGSSGTVNYLNNAQNMINAIMNLDVDAASHKIKAGDQGPLGRINPSYFAPGYYRVFSNVTGNSGWNIIADTCYNILTANAHPTTGLVSDWLPDDKYSYDACRNPWRMACDYLWFGTAKAKNIILDKQASWLSGIGAANVKDCYNLAGVSCSNIENNAFVGTFGCGLMGSDPSYQSLLNSFYTENVNLVSPLYFGPTLKVLSLFMQTGNFYLPASRPSCTSFDLGTDQTLCGSSITLRANVSSVNKTFSWRKGSDTTVIGNSATYMATSPGQYQLTIDSAGKSGCRRIDNVNVITNLYTELGPDQYLCSWAPVTLDAGSPADNTNYKWKRNGSVLSVTGRILNADSSGLYSVILSVPGCSPVSDSVRLIHNVPAVKNGSRCGAGSLSLTVTDPGTWNWFSTSLGNNSLFTGSTYTTPSISSSTTYYVDNASHFAYNTGMITKPAGTTSLNDHTIKTIFNVIQPFDLDSITIFVTIFSNVTDSLVIRLLDNTNTVIRRKKFLFTGPLSVQKFRLPVGFSLSPGNSYTLDLIGSGSNLYTEELFSGSVYPYSVSGIISITGCSIGAAAYGPFFDWRISSAGMECPRLPVTAIIYTMPSTAVAGPDQTVCSNTTLTLAATAPSSGTGLWSIVAGSANIADPNSPASAASGLVAGPITLRWTVTSSCGTSADDMIITVNSPPSLAEAGPDQDITSNVTTLAANTPASGIGKWSIINGSGNITTINDPNSEITGLVTGTDTLVWTISNGICTAFNDTVVIHVGNLPASVFSNKTNASFYFLYPNPFSNETTLRIVSQINAYLSIKIIDVYGKNLLDSKDLLTNTDIKLGSQLPPGVYFISACYENKSTVLKFIKTD